MIKDDCNIIFKSMSECIKFLKDQGIITTARRIAKAFNNDELLFEAKWLIIDNGHRKQSFSEEGKAKIIANAESRGLHLRMISEDDEKIFTSMIKAGNYIRDQELDSLHPKNIGLKIKYAAENSEELYGCKWEIIKV